MAFCQISTPPSLLLLGFCYFRPAILFDYPRDALHSPQEVLLLWAMEGCRRFLCPGWPPVPTVQEPFGSLHADCVQRRMGEGCRSRFFQECSHDGGSAFTGLGPPIKIKWQLGTHHTRLLLWQLVSITAGPILVPVPGPPEALLQVDDASPCCLCERDHTVLVHVSFGR